MPKAYDDESEFDSEVYQKLAKLSWQERLQYLAHHFRYGALLVVATLGFASSVIGTLLVTKEAAVENPMVTIGERLSAQGSKIFEAGAAIRKAAQDLPPGDARTTILEQQRVIEGEAVFLKTYGDGLAGRDKRSSFDIFTSANAQVSSPGPSPQQTNKLSAEDVRLWGVVAILGTLSAAFFMCIGIILFSNHVKRLTFAFDTVKVLLGFFVGVGTSFFGSR